MSKKVEVKILNPLRGKYKLPYSTGHVVALAENVASELIKNKDAELIIKGAKKPNANKSAADVKEIEVTDPQEETGKQE